MMDKKVLIFAGTTEGRRLTECLVAEGISCIVCVATEYGTQVMKTHPNMELRQGRLTASEMEQLMKSEALCAVVDATHPFAVAVSENIREGAKAADLPYLRLQRNTKAGALKEGNLQYHFTDNQSCAEFLAANDGNILLTTGSKELAVYCEDSRLKDRLYVRVLPGVESIQICERLGIPGSRIIALQGPFSTDLNYCLLKQYHIEWMVTKESGNAGGYLEKMEAAKRATIPVCVIGNPEKEEGLSFEEVCEQIGSLYEHKIQMKKQMEIALIGIGMGNQKGMTVEALEAYHRSDYVFGAPRLLEIGNVGKAFPYYLAEDILPCLDNINILKEDLEETTHISILFSGDSGFYSGCDKLYKELSDWAKGSTQVDIGIQIYPGISSVSFLAAATGYSWQDAELFSTHGKKNWEAKLVDAVRRKEKVYALTSGVNDVKKIAYLIKNQVEQADQITLITGFKLSYPEQEIRSLSLAECENLTKDGIYTCLIVNPVANAELKKRVTHGLEDGAFIRGEVPMTKEEIREIAVSKLRLTNDAIVYDIGSGTGSVAVEIANCSPDISVYAIEHKEQAIDLIRQNKEKFGLHNITIVESHAPSGLDQLPVPTHVFIGGSDGKLFEIMDTLKAMQAPMQVVITAVSLETISQLTDLIHRYHLENAEMVQLQVSHSKTLGKYHMMQSENPIYMLSFVL